MNDSNFIEEIARKWVELGGDSEGVAYGWKRLQEAVINIEYAQQSVQRTCAKCGSKDLSRYDGDGDNWFCSNCGASR